MATVVTPVFVPFQFIYLKIGGTTNGTHAALPHISRYGYDKKNIVLQVLAALCHAKYVCHSYIRVHQHRPDNRMGFAASNVMVMCERRSGFHSQLPSAHTLRISKSRFIVALLSACARLSILPWIKSYSQRILEFRSNVARIGWCRYMTGS